MLFNELCLDDEREREREREKESGGEVEKEGLDRSVAFLALHASAHMSVHASERRAVLYIRGVRVQPTKDSGLLIFEIK